MKTSLFILLLIFAFLNPAPTHAQEFKTSEGKVEFLSKASLNEFTGTSEKLNGLINLSEGLLDFYIDLNTLKTGIGLRDKHMRENYLETKEFPFAEFTGKINESIDLTPGQSKAVTATGKFKIHGVEREITVPGKLTAMNGNQLKLEAKFTVLLSDYNIEIPKVLFYELAEDQVVTINATLKK